MTAKTEYQPGEPAPQDGHYHGLNVFGSPTGDITHLQKGERLPALPLGYTWYWVPEDRDSSSDIHVKRIFPAVVALTQQVIQTADNQSNHLAELVNAIRRTIETYPDPCVLAGALIEGVAVTIHTRIPEEKKTEVAAAAVRLLYDQLHEDDPQ